MHIGCDASWWLTYAGGDTRVQVVTHVCRWWQLKHAHGQMWHTCASGNTRVQLLAAGNTLEQLVTRVCSWLLPSQVATLKYGRQLVTSSGGNTHVCPPGGCLVRWQYSRVSARWLPRQVVDGNHRLKLVHEGVVIAFEFSLVLAQVRPNKLLVSPQRIMAPGEGAGYGKRVGVREEGRFTEQTVTVRGAAYRKRGAGYGTGPGYGTGAG